MSLSARLNLNLIDGLKEAVYQAINGFNNLINRYGEKYKDIKKADFMKLNLLDIKIMLILFIGLNRKDEVEAARALLKEINALLPIDGDDMKNMIDLSGEINSLREENEKLKKALSHFTQ